jgi:glycosyltransferase involved in cell wall biosynthesis
MTVLHVAEEIDPKIGGIYTTVGAFVMAGQNMGWNAQVISLDSENGLRRTFPVESARKSGGPYGKLWGFANARSLQPAEQLASQCDVIVIHALYKYHATWAAAMARKYNKALVVVPHGGLDPYCFTYRRLRKLIWLKLQGASLFRNSSIIYSTKAEREKAEGRVGKTEAEVISWPVPDDLLRLAAGVAERRRPRRFLFVGRLHPMKRVLETVRAFARLDRKDCQLSVAGPETSEIRACHLAEAAGKLWNDRVFYLGELSREQLNEQMRLSDGLILLSHRENFGNVVAEGLAFGLPQIVSSGVDIGPLIVKHGAGLVYKIGDEKDVHEALSKAVATSDGEWRDMSERAAAMAPKEFSFDTFQSSVMQFMLLTMDKALRRPWL